MFAGNTEGNFEQERKAHSQGRARRKRSANPWLQTGLRKQSNARPSGFPAALHRDHNEGDDRVRHWPSIPRSCNNKNNEKCKIFFPSQPSSRPAPGKQWMLQLFSSRSHPSCREANRGTPKHVTDYIHCSFLIYCSSFQQVSTKKRTAFINFSSISKKLPNGMTEFILCPSAESPACVHLVHMQLEPARIHPRPSLGRDHMQLLALKSGMTGGGELVSPL